MKHWTGNAIAAAASTNQLGIRRARRSVQEAVVTSASRQRPTGNSKAFIAHLIYSHCRLRALANFVHLILLKSFNSEKSPVGELKYLFFWSARSHTAGSWQGHTRMPAHGTATKGGSAHRRL